MGFRVGTREASVVPNVVGDQFELVFDSDVPVYVVFNDDGDTKVRRDDEFGELKDQDGAEGRALR